ncbi:MAG: ribonuclease HII [Bifidobacteriaceae bacterium]|jgi:ribonuclease HII|nr:ribonuclease HII [Bifidobacteriaceae bacterium]
MRPTPSLERERALAAAAGPLVAGVDEVGRGALAGPLCVGVVAVSAATAQAPAGLADSKLLSPAARAKLEPVLKAWARCWALGWASPAEIDRHGLTAALRLAGRRALADLAECPDGIVLDGKHDWLTAPADLFATPAPDPWVLRVVVKADQTCACVAAAAVLAKVARDRRMVQLAGRHPGYGWDSNKGYGSASHLAAVRALGLTKQHRQSWAIAGARPPGQRERVEG